MSDFVSRNPATTEILHRFPAWDPTQTKQALRQVAAVTPNWANFQIEQRGQLLRRLAAVLRQQEGALARLITLEMGKLLTEARAEITKCATACDYYADQATAFLADETIASDATRSLVAHQPLGTILAIMPWNFPFWQVFRFAAPALIAGNTAVLKHASNVPQCALALERLFVEAGFPEHVFRTLMIASADVAAVIRDPRIHAVTLTGSEAAGRNVAACAGAALKKCVLELGGSDPFIVLADADLDLAIETAVITRFQNAGQSCIAGKRFIVVDAVADQFVERFAVAIGQLRAGNPLDPNSTLAPLARADLCDELHGQVSATLSAGGRRVTGCNRLDAPGYYYQPSLIDYVLPGMVAADQELFGPVASVLRVADSAAALQLANQTRFGLGGSIWTRDLALGEQMARQLQAGAVFVNGLVKSDPRLPFGGIKDSGYGRELSHHGMFEFLNVKTIWIR
ncbi:MAG: NAD-dependent succinate-semialdehyde dehydrogenase [Gammaproteobacteria bacterium]|nr:NAD-dependent succinate-semialdehyde dehydrogenase [Gammaproteobacteria bacterium]